MNKPSNQIFYKKNPVKQTKAINLVKAEIQTLTESQADSLTAAAYMMAKQADRDYDLRAARVAEKTVGIIESIEKEK